MKVLTQRYHVWPRNTPKINSLALCFLRLSYVWCAVIREQRCLLQFFPWWTTVDMQLRSEHIHSLVGHGQYRARFKSTFNHWQQHDHKLNIASRSVRIRSLLWRLLKWRLAWDDWYICIHVFAFKCLLDCVAHWKCE